MPILKSALHVENLLEKLVDSTDYCDIVLVAGKDKEKYQMFSVEMSNLLTYAFWWTFIWVFHLFI